MSKDNDSKSDNISKKFLITVPDPDWNQDSKEPRGTIEQFTNEGLKVATSYYNQKYPDRGEIHNSLAVRPKRAWDKAGEEKDMDSALKILREMAEAPIKELATLQARGGRHKVVLSLADGFDEEPRTKLTHSVPLVVTPDKLILMRDEENNKTAQVLISSIAKELGLDLVQPESTKSSMLGYSSIQGDDSTCHFIALGVLKDLTQSDLEEVEKRTSDPLKDKEGYLPLDKSLKYSQSSKHIKNLYDLEAQNPVKQDGRTALQYANQYKKELTEEYGKITTRITDKSNKFKENLTEMENSLSRDSSIEDVATAILKKRQLESVAKKEALEEKVGLSSSIKNEVKDIVQESRESFSQKVTLDALDLATTKEKETKKDLSEKSWVEKMADRKLSTSKDGHREI